MLFIYPKSTECTPCLDIRAYSVLRSPRAQKMQWCGDLIPVAHHSTSAAPVHNFSFEYSVLILILLCPAVAEEGAGPTIQCVYRPLGSDINSLHKMQETRPPKLVESATLMESKIKSPISIKGCDSRKRAEFLSSWTSRSFQCRLARHLLSRDIMPSLHRLE